MSTQEPEFEPPAPEEVVVPAAVPATAPTAVYGSTDVAEGDAGGRPAENEEAERRDAGRSGSVKGVRVLSLLVIIAGALLIAAGAVTWYEVSRQLGDEHIVVSDDASHFAGDRVQDPITAFTQADTIRKHSLAASGGQTYAQLAQNDPVRQTVMTASFLRASLFTSVVSFGVAAFAVIVGVLMIIIGYALRRLSRMLDLVRNSPATAV